MSKKFFISVLLCGALILINHFMLQIWNSHVAVQFISAESKSAHGNLVQNTIRYFENATQEIWMMNQTSEGGVADRLMIIVNKVEKTARFFQLQPGDLEFSSEIFRKEKAFKVSCFICHANGPRAIRPAANSNLGFIDRTKIFVWSYKIKRNGVISPDLKHLKEDANLEIPFAQGASIENDVLEVKTCYGCHNGTDRSTLKRQQSLAIRYLVDSGAMPLEKSLEPEEIKLINRFVSGF